MREGGLEVEALTCSILEIIAIEVEMVRFILEILMIIGKIGVRVVEMNRGVFMAVEKGVVDLTQREEGGLIFILEGSLAGMMWISEGIIMRGVRKIPEE
jgi:hypothetical protein